ncbi:MAG: hypothetical protein KJ736_08015 [Candidatus Omnitrophica bacterium]|nr:hypothetical protein [Candidatus Omnitrophota bacterium]
MKISDHIQKSLDACDRRDLDSAMLFTCLAIDGTSKKVYPEINSVGKRFRKFIRDQLDIIELMFGGLNLQETVFPFTNSKGEIGMKFEDIIYEKFRCNFAHGNELEKGYGINLKIAEHCQQFEVNIKDQSMTMPESSIFALGIVCILASPNKDQQIGSNSYYYYDGINKFVIDRWWGKEDCARQIMDFDNQVRVKMDFSNVWPRA